MHACMHAKSLHSCPTLCDPIDCSPWASSVHGMLQARILEWVAMPFSRGSSRSRDQTWVSCDSCIAGGFFTAEPQGRPFNQCRESVIVDNWKLTLFFSLWGEVLISVLNDLTPIEGKSHSHLFFFLSFYFVLEYSWLEYRLYIVTLLI